MPRSFQTRLTFAFIGVVALTLALVAPIVVNRIDDYFRQQEEQSLQVRAKATAAVIDQFIETTLPGDRIVAESNGQAVLNPDVADILVTHDLLRIAANNVAQADVTLEFGLAKPDTDGTMMTDPDRDLSFSTRLDIEPEPGPGPGPRRSRAATSEFTMDQGDPPWGMVVTLSNPYTSRASTLAAITGLLLVMAGVAFLVAVLVAAFLARRFTTPLTRLTEASRRLAEGDLSSRVTTDEVSSSTTELRALSQQFNTMADRLEQSVAIIRRDRDYSRDFLADVSHELRTPIAAMRTFIELLQGPAGRDPAARDRVPRLLRRRSSTGSTGSPRTCSSSRSSTRGSCCSTCDPTTSAGTIESAVEQQRPAAERKGIELTTCPAVEPAPDPPRPAAASARSSPTSSATRSSSPSGGRIDVIAAPDCPTAARRSRSWTRASASQPRRAAADLRPLLPRLRGQRGARHGLRPGAGDREVDRRHAPRDDRGREPASGVGSRFVVRLPRDPRDVSPSRRRPAQPSASRRRRRWTILHRAKARR